MLDKVRKSVIGARLQNLPPGGYSQSIIRVLSTICCSWSPGNPTKLVVCDVKHHESCVCVRARVYVCVCAGVVGCLCVCLCVCVCVWMWVGGCVVGVG